MSRHYKTVPVPFFRHAITGEVKNLADWQDDYYCLTTEEWGGKEFEDAPLVEVVPDGKGGWKEV